MSYTARENISKGQKRRWDKQRESEGMLRRAASAHNEEIFVESGRAPTP